MTNFLNRLILAVAIIMFSVSIVVVGVILALVVLDIVGLTVAGWVWIGLLLLFCATFLASWKK